MPVWMREEGGHHVCEEDKRQPFEEACDNTVGGPHKQGEQKERIQGRPVERVDPRYHFRRLGHAAKVSTNVEHIRHNQQEARPPQRPAGIRPPQDAC